MTAGRHAPWMIWIPGAEKSNEDAGTDVMAADGTQEASGAAVADGDGARTMEWQGFS